MKPENELLEKVKFLLDENEYYADMQDEVNEELLDIDEEMKVFLNLYTEYNRKNNDKGLELKRCEKELKAIVEKQTRLNGRITKKDSERKQELESLIQTLEAEKKNDKKNREDARKAFHKIIDSNPSFNNSLRINEYQSKIDQNIAELQEIYNNCKEAIENLDKQIADMEEKFTEAALNKDTGAYLQLSAEYIELNSQKDNVYNRYKEIIRLIESKQVLNIQEPVVSITKGQQTELSEDDIKEKMARAAKIAEEREKAKQNSVGEEPVVDVEPELSKEEQNEKMARAAKIAEEREKERQAKNPDKVVDKQPKVEEERIFVDADRIDKGYEYLSVDNAKNIGKLNGKIGSEVEKEEKNDKKAENIAKENEKKSEKGIDTEPVVSAEPVDKQPEVDNEPVIEPSVVSEEPELSKEEMFEKMARAAQIAEERDKARQAAPAAQATNEDGKNQESEEVEEDVELNDDKKKAIKEVLSSAKDKVVNLGKGTVKALGKIKNIIKLPKPLNNLISKKIKNGEVKVNAGTEESLEAQHVVSR